MSGARHTISYSISSILLLIFGIVFGGILFSVQKTAETLLPFQSNSSGSTLEVPIAATGPNDIPHLGVFSGQLTSSIATQNPAEWYKDYKQKVEKRYSFKVTESSPVDTTASWTGKTLCNGQPLAGVYIEDSITGTDGSFSIPVKSGTAFYHPTYGTIVRSQDYNTLSGDIDFCTARGGNSKVDSKYFINPETLEVKLSARVYDTDTSPTQGWEDEYAYLQCWTWSGQWDLKVNEWKKLNTDSTDMIPLLTLDKGKRNYFVCRTYTYDQGQYAGPECITNHGTNPIQEYVHIGMTKMAENLDSCKQVRKQGAIDTLFTTLSNQQVDPSIVGYCEREYPVYWQTGPVNFTENEDGCGKYFSFQRTISPLLSARNIPMAERYAVENTQFDIPTTYNKFCVDNYSYMTSGPLKTVAATDHTCGLVYHTLYGNFYTKPPVDESLLVKKNFHYDPSMIQSCKTALPQLWLPYVPTSALTCTRIKAYETLGTLDTNLPALGLNSTGQQQLMKACKADFQEIMFESSDFTYSNNQCQQIAEWNHIGTLQSEMTAKGYKGEKVAMCKELYPSYFTTASLNKVKDFRNTGVIETDHIKLYLTPNQKTALKNPIEFVNTLEKLYLTYSDMVGGKPYDGKQIPLQSKCPYSGPANVDLKTATCPYGTMTHGNRSCDGVQNGDTCSTGWKYSNYAWGLASWYSNGIVNPTQIIDGGLDSAVSTFNNDSRVMLFGIVHEFGHNFDGIAVNPQYNFGAGASVESLANIKLIHMMDKLGVQIILGNSTYDSTEDFLNKFYRPLYNDYKNNANMDFFKVMEADPSTGLRTTYSGVVGPLADYNMMVLQTKAEKIGIQKLFDTLKFYNTHTPASTSSNDTNYIRRLPDNQIRNKMEQFVYFLSAHGKMDLSQDFIEDKYPISNSTKQKISTYLALPVTKQTASNMIRIDHGLSAL